MIFNFDFTRQATLVFRQFLTDAFTFRFETCHFSVDPLLDLFGFPLSFVEVGFALNHGGIEIFDFLEQLKDFIRQDGIGLLIRRDLFV